MESTNKDPHRNPNRRRRLCVCILITAGILVSLAVVLLILGLTVFRVRHAVTTVNSVRLSSLRAGLNVPALSVDLNVTLGLDLTTSNPNPASFRYGDGSAELSYRGAVVGEAAIPPGEIPADGSARSSVDLTILAGRLIADGAVYADVAAGSVAMTTYTRIPGRVTVLWVFRHHMVAYTTCDVVVRIRNRTVENSDCRYRTEL